MSRESEPRPEPNSRPGPESRLPESVFPEVVIERERARQVPGRQGRRKTPHHIGSNRLLLSRQALSPAPRPRGADVSLESFVGAVRTPTNMRTDRGRVEGDRSGESRSVVQARISRVPRRGSVRRRRRDPRIRSCSERRGRARTRDLRPERTAHGSEARFTWAGRSKFVRVASMKLTTTSARSKTFQVALETREQQRDRLLEMSISGYSADDLTEAALRSPGWY